MVGSRSPVAFSGSAESSAARIGALRALEERRATSASSILRPLYCTMTRSAVSATTPILWVIMISPMPCSACSRIRRSRICFWIVTSSAVVGSSAISSFGLQAMRHGDHHALALAARHLVRKGAKRRSAGSGMPTCVEQLDRARARRCPRSMPMMDLQHLLDLEADGEARIEARHRLLEDHRDVLADDLAALAVGSASSRSRPSKVMRVGASPSPSTAAGP